MARNHKLSRKQRRIKHKVTFRTLFLLSITLIFNTYAWFLYATTVSTNLTAHVDAWRVDFAVEESMVEREINFVVAHAYPGMPTVVQTVNIANAGERPADIQFEVRMVRIFDTYFMTQDYASEQSSVPTGTTIMTPQQLLSKIQNDYPFYLTIQANQNTLVPGQTSYLTTSFDWAYETGADATDTNYGTLAYDYYENNNGAAAFQTIFKILVIQHPTSPTATPTVTPTPTAVP